MAYIPDQSKGMTQAMKDELMRTLSGFAGMATSSVAEPIAGLNALLRGRPELVEQTRNALTYGNPADIMPRNFRLPEAVNTGIGYFNESADRLGAISPVAGAALKTAPTFVAAMLPASSRAAFSSVGGDIGNALTNPALRTGANAQRGYIAYHGTPHKFDKFELDKAGSGVGQNAFGHGLYFSDSKPVAAGYIAPEANSSVSSFKYAGKPITSEVKQSAAYYLNSAGGDKAAAIDMLGGERFKATKLGKQLVKHINDMNYEKLKPDGTLFEVDIPDDHLPSMLDWDSPISAQPESIRKAIQPAIDQAAKSFPAILKNDGLTGEGLYQALKGHRGGSAETASQYLNSIGIKGIRYIDKYSKGAGEGVMNTVVFDDSSPRILRKE